MGVPEWNEAEINAVLELWIQHNRQSQWKPIAKELATLNATGALNPELASKGLERTNNAVMNKVKELSGLSCARRVKPRTVGNFANWSLNGPQPLVGDTVAANSVSHVEHTAGVAGDGQELDALGSATARRSAVNSPSVAGGAALQGAVAIATAQLFAEHVDERLPAIPMPPSCAQFPSPPAVHPVGCGPQGGVGGREPTRKRGRHQSQWSLPHAARGRHTPVAAVSPCAPEVPVIVQRKAVVPSYAAGTGPAVKVVGPWPTDAAYPIAQDEF
jgi:hypothetical protein